MRIDSWRRSFAFGCLLSALLVSVPMGAPAVAADDAPPYVADEAIVAVERGEKADAVESIEASDGEVVSFSSAGDFFVVETPDESLDWAQDLENDDGVRFAEPNYLVTTEVTPNDTEWAGMWGLQKIGAPEAWDTNTGDGVVVAVIDTGVDYTHEDLENQMWTNPGEIAGNGDDDDGNGYIDDVQGIDCLDDDVNPMDAHGHGTHIAGTIGAEGNNATGVPGINWDVQLMALRFLDSTGVGDIADAIECLDYATEMGAQVSNNSWGGPAYSQLLHEAIARAEDEGSLFVAAAGNDGSNNDAEPSYPASDDNDNVVSVAATTSTDSLASFSNYGDSTVDIAAPGVSILSTAPGDDYDTMDGTSMAAPHVTGAAALLWSEYPTSSYAEIIDRIYGSVDHVTALDGEVATSGRLDLAAAIASDPLPPGPSLLQSTGTDRTSVDLAWTSPFEDGITGGPVASYDLSFSISGAGEWAEAPAPTPAAPTSVQSTTVGGLAPDTSYDFRLTSKDNAGNTTFETITAATGPGVVVFTDDAEAGDDQWNASSPWAITSERPHSGSHSWSDSPDERYEDRLTTTLRTEPIPLVGVMDPELSFWHRFATEPGFDRAYVEASADGGPWEELARYSGHLTQFRPVGFDLEDFAGSSSIEFRFRLASDTYVEFDGWYIDDVQVTGSGMDLEAPATPTGLTAADPQTGESLELDWDDNPEPDLAGYNVYRAVDGSSDWDEISDGPIPGSAYSDDGLENGVTYRYMVSAVDVTANQSAQSVEANASPTDSTPPAAPTGLTADGTDDHIALDWSNNPEADLAGYEVYRTLAGAASWTKLNTATIATSSYVDTSATVDVTYDYRVTAVDDTGNESAPSVKVTAERPAAATAGGGGGGGGGGTPPSTPTPTPTPTASPEEPAVGGPGAISFHRTVTLRLRKSLIARGRVGPEGGPAPCLVGVSVSIRRNGKVIAHPRTDDQGRFRAALPDRRGRYVASVRFTRVDLGGSGSESDVCLDARSKARSRRH